MQIERVFTYCHMESEKSPKGVNVNSVHKQGDSCTEFTLHSCRIHGNCHFRECFVKKRRYSRRIHEKTCFREFFRKPVTHVCTFQGIRILNAQIFRKQDINRSTIMSYFLQIERNRTWIIWSMCPNRFKTEKTGHKWFGYRVLLITFSKKQDMHQVEIVS